MVTSAAPEVFQPAGRRAVHTCFGVSFAGRPPLRPRARADARPAIGCSRITSRSFSASAADIWNSRRTDLAVFSLVRGERGKPGICFDRTFFQIG